MSIGHGLPPIKQRDLTGPMDAPPNTLVHLAFSRLEQAVNDASTEAVRLIARLESAGVVTPADPQTMPTSGVGDSPGCKMADYINSRTDALRLLALGLQSTIDRLQI